MALRRSDGHNKWPSTQLKVDGIVGKTPFMTSLAAWHSIKESRPCSAWLTGGTSWSNKGKCTIRLRVVRQARWGDQLPGLYFIRRCVPIRTCDPGVDHSFATCNTRRCDA